MTEDYRSGAELAEGFAAAAALAELMGTLAISIVGATVLIILQLFFVHTVRRRYAVPCVLFLPAWAALGVSVAYALTLHDQYLATLFVRQSEELLMKQIELVSKSLSNQIRWLEIGLLFLGCWLFWIVCIRGYDTMAKDRRTANRSDSTITGEGK